MVHFHGIRDPNIVSRYLDILGNDCLTAIDRHKCNYNIQIELGLLVYKTTCHSDHHPIVSFKLTVLLEYTCEADVHIS